MGAETDWGYCAGYVQVIAEEGMPEYGSSKYGDLYIEYNVVLPSVISKDVKQSTLFVLYYRPSYF